MRDAIAQRSHTKRPLPGKEAAFFYRGPIKQDGVRVAKPNPSVPKNSNEPRIRLRPEFLLQWGVMTIQRHKQ